jgi:hypothetical protein
VKKLCLSVAWLLVTGMLMAACSGSSPCVADPGRLARPSILVLAASTEFILP